MKRIKYLIIVFYLALFVGLALYDETPAEGLVREASRPLPETIEPGNAWIIFLGFAAPDGVSPYSYGEKKMQKLKAAVSAGKSYTEFLTSTIEDGRFELQFQEKLPSFYTSNIDGMLPYAAAHVDEIATLRHNNKKLLQRYEALHRYTRYNEPLDYGFFTPIPSFSPIRNSQKIRLLELAVIANQGDMKQALAELRKDMEFWRFVSRNSSTLISKLISFASLQADLRFAAELGASHDLNASEMLMLQEIMKPFSGDESSLATTLRGESRYGQRGMELIYRQGLKAWNPSNLLFKSNATLNRMYSDNQRFIRLAELSSQEFAQEIEKQSKNTRTFRRIGIPFLYNPAGEFLASIEPNTPVTQNYIEKGHNLEGLRRLACLKVLAHQKHVPPGQMPQFLASHTLDFGNPYTGGAMTWDGKKGSITFKGLSEGKSVEIYL